MTTKETPTRARDVVIWSADVDDATLKRALTDADQNLQFVKLDLVRLIKMGFPIIRTVQEEWGYKVFADAKIYEVPVKVLELAELSLEHKPWMLNVMADIWSTDEMTHQDPKKVEVLKRYADACLAVGTKPCAVTVLTSKAKDVVKKQFNGRNAVEQVLVYAEVLLRAGFTDMVCSPQEVNAIRQYSRFDDIQLNTPAIRLPDTSNDDQARVATPAGAIENGSDRLVIGRNLTSGNLAENFARVAANLGMEE